MRCIYSTNMYIYIGYGYTSLYTCTRQYSARVRAHTHTCVKGTYSITRHTRKSQKSDVKSAITIKRSYLDCWFALSSAAFRCMKKYRKFRMAASVKGMWRVAVW